MGGLAIDSNVLIRYFTWDDERLAAEAERIVDGARYKSIMLDRIIFAELGYVLRSRYGFSRKRVVEMYAWLLESPAFSVTDRDLVSRTIDLFRTETPLSFEDCWLLALKRSGHASDVATFDQPLKKRL